MKIENLVAPAKADSLGGQRTPSQSAARERAIAKLTGGQPPQAVSGQQPEQQAPVLNPSKVSPEDMPGILSQPSEVKEESVNQQAQSDNSEQESPPKEATKEEAPLSAQYAQLARKEKALRAQAQELKRQQIAFKAAQELASKPVQSEAPDLSAYIQKDQLKSNLWNTLSELGITYDEVTQQALNAPNPGDVALAQLQKRMETELKAIRDKQDAQDKAAIDQQTQAYKDAVDQIRNDTKRLVDSDDRFEMIKATNSYEDVVELIEATWKQDKILLSSEESAQEIEDYLTDEALKLARNKKIQSRLKSVTQSPAQKPQSEQPKQPQQAKTLTNGMGTAKPLSNRDRAILAFKGQLTKK